MTRMTRLDAKERNPKFQELTGPLFIILRPGKFSSQFSTREPKPGNVNDEERKQAEWGVKYLLKPVFITIQVHNFQIMLQYNQNTDTVIHKILVQYIFMIPKGEEGGKQKSHLFLNFLWKFKVLHT